MKKKFRLNKMNKKRYIILTILLILIICLSINSKTIINSIREIFNKEELLEFECKTYSADGSTGQAVITIRNKEGIKKVSYVNNDKIISINGNGKTSISFDYKMVDRKQYNIEVEFIKGQNKTYTFNYEIPRINGEYTLVNGVYVNKPDVSTGFVKEKTRYMYLNDAGNLVPGNWLTDEEPENWYDYSQRNWANIFVENNGISTYYVWIPRYVYKILDGERTDVKFINTYNEYIDQNGNITTWDELKRQGYELPEAFSWNASADTSKYFSGSNLIMPGYWMTKYQLSNLESTYIINYLLNAGKQKINVNNMTTSTTKTIAKYTYAINGKVVHESTSPDSYDFENPGLDRSIINVTALDENNEIIGSMTKELTVTEVNPPDLTGFDKDTTFYVYWDNDENEHNEIPITMEPPAEWYNYTYRQWANIVTRNNGVETYYVWIPRYAYSLDTTSQRTNIAFLKDTSTEVPTGYEIPEAFTWVNNSGQTIQLTGYWMTKYQLSQEESSPRLYAEISAANNKIVIGDITGSRVTEGLKYEYYLDGVLKHEGNDTKENYIYSGLEEDKTYTVNIIARNMQTNEFVAAITKKLTTIVVNKPEFGGKGQNGQTMGFNPDKTYYVLYNKNDSGEEVETIGDKIKLDGSNMPSNWYDYSEQKWANIVVTDGTVENGKITGATYKTYYVWIPRYSYTINSTRQRTNVIFIEGTSTNVPAGGYQIPEAFTWVNNSGQTIQLPGYWMTKYQLNN